ncbi:LOW QUALITY PROTEIN: hypothetical protein PHMEG_0004457 [Phytophthora megakarya]|uniref:Uncharacterized protein n=1 Tax=Phytophthora megakarya TaxID=4795 RepID=A0A225WTY8_9STRA|nr:LOW QUALITY PROTEIN: hypothetical protein PHMEG_0004457 [Phytophthora megakarya]
MTWDDPTEDGPGESPPVGSEVDSNSDSTLGDLGVSGPDALSRRAIKVKYRAVDRTSRKSQLGQDVIGVDALGEKTFPSETPTIKLEGTLFAVKEETTSDVLGEGSRPRLGASMSLNSRVQVADVEVTSRMQTPKSTREAVDLTAVDDAVGSEHPVTPNPVKVYMDDQVLRREQVALEFVMSPMVASHMGLPCNVGVFGVADIVGSSIADLDLRMQICQFDTKTDFMSETGLMNEQSMRESVAVLQTMLVEVGLKFRNLVPERFRVRTSKAEVDAMRRAAEALQYLLTVELLE